MSKMEQGNTIYRAIRNNGMLVKGGGLEVVKVPKTKKRVFTTLGIFVALNQVTTMKVV